MTIMVSISQREYNDLLEAQAKLDRLEAYGVDNWQGYADAMTDSMQIFTEEEG